MQKLKLIIWPILFGFLGYGLAVIGSNDKVSFVPTLVGFVFGCTLSLAVALLKNRPKVRFFVMVFGVFLWALIIFGVTYPDLITEKNPRGSFSPVPVAILMVLPIIVLLVVQFWNRKFWRKDESV